MVHLRLTIFSFVLMNIFWQNTALSQSADSSFFNTLSFSALINIGIYNASNVKLQSILDSRPILGEIDVTTQTTGKRLWEQINGYPVFGLGLIYGNSGSRAYIGNILGLFPFVNLPVLRSHGFSLFGKFGIGVGWVEKPFNPQTNYENLVIGSHLNACINLNLTAQFQIQPHLYLDFAAGLNHMSNGGTKLPNLGLNIPLLSLGFKYNVNPNFKKISHPIPAVIKKINCYLIVSAAITQNLQLEGPSYLVNLVNFEVLKNFSHTGRYGLGVNLTYDPSLGNEIYNSAIFAFDMSKSKFVASVYGAYEYVMGRLSIPLQIGIYLYNNYPVNWVYETLGLRYQFANHFIVGAALKIHAINADFIYWGLGYKF
jgi:hypothetical protein